MANSRNDIPGGRAGRGGSGDRRTPSGGQRPPRSRDEGERPFRKRPEGERPRAPRGAEAPRGGDERIAETPIDAVEPAEERIAKVIARAGIASRRDAEAMIAEGRVRLNGSVLTSPAQNVTSADAIEVDGEPLPVKERTRLWLFHKPRGLVTTARDPEGRPTVFDELPEDLPRVVAIGRLDINTEGLLLLTNDGGLAKVIAHPDTGWLRRYRVRAYGDITQDRLNTLRGGISIDGMDYGPIEASLDRQQGDNSWITLGLREGKNREVKRILEHLGLRVNRLIRVSFGPFQLGELEPGEVDEIRTRVLKDQLGEKLAQEAGVDFESPVREPIAPFGSTKAAKPPAPQPRAPRDRSEDRERGPRAARFDDRERGPRARSDDRERAPRARSDERPPRSRDERRPAREGDAPPRRPSWDRKPTPSVWRAGEQADDGAERKAKPRRAAPRDERMASERAHERVGAISARGGRVLVERLVSEPKQEERERPARAPRREGAERSERAPRRFADAERPARGPRREGAERSERAPRRFADAERPARGPRREGSERPRSAEDRPGPGSRIGPRGGGGGKSFGEKSFGGKSFGGKSFGAKSFGDKRGKGPGAGKPGFRGPRPGSGSGGPRPGRPRGGSGPREG